MQNELARLNHRSNMLTARLNGGTDTEIAAARELMRQSLVALYRLGHWQTQPGQFKTYMRLYRARGPVLFSPPESSFVPDKMVRYSL